MKITTQATKNCLFMSPPLRRYGTSGKSFLQAGRAPCGILLLPLAAVEGLDIDGFDGRRIEAAGVDAVAVGMRARYVERLDPARRAEEMLGDTRVERVGRQSVLALQQPEP